MFNRSSLIAALTFALTGCATTASQQLVEARQLYATSSTGLASKLAPTELYDAKKVLDKADAEFVDKGDTALSRDYAYIATRKVQLADVKARTAQDRERIAEAAKAGIVVRDNQATANRAALNSTRDMLTTERRDNQASTNELRATNSAQAQALVKSADQLDAERTGRMDAEKKLAGAMKDLASVAAVKEEARGVVITLSGSVLFVSGQFTLLNTAMSKLDSVAEAIKMQDAGKHIVVEGHTDSAGTVAGNEVLSLNRANSVRNYLVQKGVDASKISAVGLGATRPIALNTTAENRANNRRVEIVIQPAAAVTER
jgi:outer membrane protein OmpA-like peptidoglycan-associated protein